jgi:heme exporter protein CcmD
MSGFPGMGAYGAFIWPCFALAVIVLVGNIAAARRLHAVARKRAMRRATTAQGKP